MTSTLREVARGGGVEWLAGLQEVGRGGVYWLRLTLCEGRRNPLPVGSCVLVPLTGSGQATYVVTRERKAAEDQVTLRLELEA